LYNRKYAVSDLKKKIDLSKTAKSTLMKPNFQTDCYVTLL